MSYIVDAPFRYPPMPTNTYTWTSPAAPVQDERAKQIEALIEAVSKQADVLELLVRRLLAEKEASK